MDNDQNKKKSHKGLRELLSIVFIVTAAPLLAVLLTAYVFQFYQVDGSSMERTLQNNDRLIVWKLPRTFSKITGGEHMPDRGDIIVFSKSELLDTNGKAKQLIKRVIALPGERILIKDGKITVFNTEHPNGFNPDTNQEFTKNLPEKTSGEVDEVVPEGQIFVCGDNRSGSLDSRVFGAIPVKDIVGELAFRVLPMSKFDSY